MFTAARPARLAFFGSDDIALPALEAIRRDLPQVKLVAVFSQPDRPAGRGQKVQPNAISAWAETNDIPLFRPEKPDESTVAAIREQGCDLVLVMAYGHILKKALLDTPPLGFFNLHGSLLPRYRGATPIEGAIVGGDTVTGVSLQRVVPRLDAGDVVDAETFPLTDTDTTTAVRERLALASAALVRRALPRILDGTAAYAPQAESAACFTRKIRREDASLDFHAPARELAARIRALHPWPGVTVPFGDAVLKIGSADTPHGDGRTGAPGEVIAADKHGVIVATGDGLLRLRELQRPGGKMLPAQAFLAGCPIAPGTRFPSLAMAPLIGDTPFKMAPKPVA